ATVPYTLSLHDALPIFAEFKAALGATAPVADATSIVRKATRLVGATALAAAPAVSSVSAAVSSVSTAVGERVDKSAIPFALKGRSEEHTSELQSLRHLV